jgi:hypothetical protein
MTIRDSTDPNRLMGYLLYAADTPDGERTLVETNDTPHVPNSWAWLPKSTGDGKRRFYFPGVRAHGTTWFPRRDGEKGALSIAWTHQPGGLRVTLPDVTVPSMKGRVLPYPLPGSRPLLVSGYGDDPNDVRLAMEWAHIQWAQDRNGHRYRGFCGWVFDAPASEATEGGRTGRVGLYEWEFNTRPQFDYRPNPQIWNHTPRFYLPSAEEIAEAERLLAEAQEAAAAG